MNDVVERQQRGVARVHAVLHEMVEVGHLVLRHERLVVRFFDVVDAYLDLQQLPRQVGVAVASEIRLELIGDDQVQLSAADHDAGQLCRKAGDLWERRCFEFIIITVRAPQSD